MKKPRGGREPKLPARRPAASTIALLPALALFTITFITYFPSTRCGYIWDDDQYVTENPTLTDAAGLARIWFNIGATPQYYPMVFTTFWIERHLWGLHPAGYHAVNILLHAISAVLLWRILKRLELPVAWFAAALFAIHPVHVESVTWITERKNVLSGVFYLSSALAYFRFAHIGPTSSSKARAYSLALVLFILALASKTVTATFPAAMLLVLWWKHGRITRNDLVLLLPFFAVGIASGVLTAVLEKSHVGAEGHDWNFTVVDRCLIAGRVLWFYFAKLLWPHPLIFIYPRWQIDSAQLWQYFFPISAALLLGALWALRNRHGRGAFTSAAFFAGTLVPALGFVNVYPMRFSFVADHFQYLASIGPLAGLSAMACRLLGNVKPVARRTAAGILLFILAAIAWNQQSIYRSETTLWQNTIRQNSRAWIGLTNLAIELVDQGEYAEAETLLTRSLALHPDDAKAEANLGSVLLKMGRLEEAVPLLESAIHKNPRLAHAHNSLGLIWQRLNQHEKALKCFRAAIDLNPLKMEARYNIGCTLITLGRVDEGIAELELAQKMAPDDGDIAHALQIARAAKAGKGP